MAGSFNKFKLEFNKGEIIFCEYELGSKIYFIQKGQVRLVKISNRNEKTLAILNQGDIFGEMAMLEKMPRSATCIAETDVVLLGFNQETFLTLVKAQPSVGIKLIKSFAKRILDQNRKLGILLLENDEMKILDTLLMLYEKGNVEVGSKDGKKIVEVIAKLEEISGWTNLTASQVQANLNLLEVSQTVNVNKETISIRNIEHVKNLVEKSKKK